MIFKYEEHKINKIYKTEVNGRKTAVSWIFREA